ncbi:aldehyde dehydrogenase family protein, partial [uncultured Aeromicrobium sp.]|uniref:aldehyde dehydrogenase family protein n=1 Tax=uncultured Aeromicrobium sp. TaxID=337820 RepID=UPI0025F04511
QLDQQLTVGFSDKVTRLLQDAVGRGAEVLTGGGTPPGPGYFVEPTVLSGVDPQAALMSTEIFGPLAAVTTFESIDEVVARANATPWGLVAYVMTTDIDRAFYLTERLETGMVGLNTGVVSTPSAPFGGVKESGLGREGGRTGIEEFLETKYLSIPRRTPIGVHA